MPMHTCNLIISSRYALSKQGDAHHLRPSEPKRPGRSRLGTTNHAAGRAPVPMSVDHFNHGRIRAGQKKID